SVHVSADDESNAAVTPGGRAPDAVAGHHVPRGPHHFAAVQIVPVVVVGGRGVVRPAHYDDLIRRGQGQPQPRRPYLRFTLVDIARHQELVQKARYHSVLGLAHISDVQQFQRDHVGRVLKQHHITVL